LENGDKVRYIGVDAPELGEPGPKDDECLAWVARLRNMQLLGRGEVTLVKDEGADKDKYGRLLRYVYVDDIFVNEVMVREGLANKFFCQPGWENCPITSDNERKNIIISASQYAKNNNIGIFGNACNKQGEEEGENSKSSSVSDNNIGEKDSKKDNNKSQNNNPNTFFFSDGASYKGMDTFIKAHPNSISSSSNAFFIFSSSRKDAGFKCNLNNSSWQDCQASSSWEGLDDGMHNLSVKSYFEDESDSTPAEFNWIIDTLVPTSSLQDLAEEQEDPGFNVSWQGNDPEGVSGSGLAGFDVQYRGEEGDWQNWIIATTTTSTAFNIEIERGQEICFRSRAFDYAGNLEEWNQKEGVCTYLQSSEIPELDYFSLQSLTSSSTAYTASTTVGLSYQITNQEFVNAYLFSISSTTPLAGDNRWATSTPQYFTFSAGDGQKQIYFWVKHHENEINYMGSASIVLDTVPPQAPDITNIIPQNGIYWVATSTALLAGEKEFGVNKIYIDDQGYDFISSSTDWNLLYEFGFTGDGLAQSELAQADFWACAAVIQPISEFQTKTLILQAQDEAGNLSDIKNVDFQMDVYAPDVVYFDGEGGRADGYVYLSVQAMDNYLGGSGIKKYDFEYKQEQEGDWQSLTVSDWDDEIFKYRALLPAGNYSVRAIVYDWVNNASEFSEEISVVSNPRPVLSEIYGGGGNSGSYWQNDFIELYNPTDNDMSLDGWSVQYAPAESSNWNVTELSGVIPSQGFYLIEEYQGVGGEEALPAPDISGNINLAAGSGKVTLVSSTEEISGLADDNVVDFIGYGGANEFEGEAGAPDASNTDSIERKATQYSTIDSMSSGGAEESSGNGYDSNENSADWLNRSLPEPQGTASSTESL